MDSIVVLAFLFNSDLHSAGRALVYPEEEHLYVTGFQPQGAISDEHQGPAQILASVVVAESRRSGWMAPINIELDIETETRIWGYRCHKQSLDNTISFNTLLRITTRGVPEPELLGDLLRPVELPSAESLDLMACVHWVIRVVEFLYDNELVGLRPNKEEALAGLREEVDSIFTNSNFTPRDDNIPRIMISKYCY